MISTLHFTLRVAVKAEASGVADEEVHENLDLFKVFSLSPRVQIIMKEV